MLLTTITTAIISDQPNTEFLVYTIFFSSLKYVSIYIFKYKNMFCVELDILQKYFSGNVFAVCRNVKCMDYNKTENGKWKRDSGCLIPGLIT